jgi:hypothetical protein
VEAAQYTRDVGELEDFQIDRSPWSDFTKMQIVSVILTTLTGPPKATPFTNMARIAQSEDGD